MRPLHLTLDGFTSFRAPVELDFSSLDLFAITGPTGAGKSSLIDALTFALYGQVPRVGREYKQLMSHGAERLSVKLDFRMGDETYRIARTLKSSGAPQSRIGSWVENIAQDQQGSEGPPHRGIEKVLAPEIFEMKVPAGAWTKITEDSHLVRHLLSLYFCWEYPTFASLSKEHFLKDFQHGRERYCSAILVNALLALGCRFSSQPNTRSKPDDPYTSGDHFFEECQRLFRQEEEHHNVTTIQALGIMSIREASCGRDSESWYYAGQSIRLAIEMGLHRISDTGGDEDEMAVQAATFWGAFALDQ